MQSALLKIQALTCLKTQDARVQQTQGACAQNNQSDNTQQILGDNTLTPGKCLNRVDYYNLVNPRTDSGHNINNHGVHARDDQGDYTYLTQPPQPINLDDHIPTTYEEAHDMQTIHLFHAFVADIGGTLRRVRDDHPDLFTYSNNDSWEDIVPTIITDGVVQVILEDPSQERLVCDFAAFDQPSPRLSYNWEITRPVSPTPTPLELAEYIDRMVQACPIMALISKPLVLREILEFVPRSEIVTHMYTGIGSMPSIGYIRWPTRQFIGEKQLSEHYSVSVLPITGTLVCTLGALALKYGYKRYMLPFYRDIFVKPTRQVLKLGDSVTRLAISTEKTLLEFERWRKIILTFDFSILSPTDRSILIEIKSLIHFLYHLYQGEKGNAMCWASNLLITRPEMIKDIMMFPFDKIKSFTTTPLANIKVLGMDCAVDRDYYKRMVDAYERDPSGFANGVIPVQMHAHDSSNMESVMEAFAKNFHLPGLTPDDIKRMNNQFTFINHTKRFAMDSVNAGSVLISVLCRTIFGVDPFDPEYVTFVGKIMDVISYSRSVAKWPASMFKDRKTLRSVVTYYDEACIVSLNPRMAAVPRFLSDPFQKELVKLKGFANQYENAMYGSHDRVPPLSVVFSGAPGSGKTRAMKAACEGLTRLDSNYQVEYDPLMLYTVAAGSEYHDGYNGQKFTFIDDMWKTEAMEERIAHTNMLMDFVNTSVCNLNIANMDGKGCTRFVSEYLFSSTNLMVRGYAHTKFDVGVTDVEAVKRRFHFIFHRDEKAETDIWKNTYTVDKVLPGFEFELGKRYTTSQCIALMHRGRNELIRLHTENKITVSELDAHLGRPPENSIAPISVVDGGEGDLMAPSVVHRGLPLPCVHPDEVETHTYAFKWNYYTPLSMFTTALDLKLYDWSDTENLQYYVALFGLLSAAALVPTVYNYLYPVETHSPNCRDKEARRQAIIDEMYMADQMKGISSDAYNSEEYFNYVAGIEDEATKKKKKKPTLSTHSDNYSFYQSMVNSLQKSMMFVGGRSLTLDGETVLHEGSAQALHLDGGVVVTCAHWFVHFENAKNASLLVNSMGKSYWMPFPNGPGQYKRITSDTGKNVDLVVFVLDKKVPLPMSSLKYLVDLEHVDEIPDGQNMVLMTVDSRCDINMKRLIKAPFSTPVQYTRADQLFVVEHPIGYFSSATAGDSGGLVIVQGPQGKPNIVGIHVAMRRDFFKKDMTLATPITKQWMEGLITGMRRVEYPELKPVTVETHDRYDFTQTPTHIVEDDKKGEVRDFITKDIDVTYRLLEPVVIETHDEDEVDTKALTIEQNKEVEEKNKFPLRVEYTVPTDDMVVPARRSKITKGLLYGWSGAPHKIPAILTPQFVEGRYVHPLHQALKKMQQDPVEEASLSTRTMEYLQYLYPRPTSSRILTPDEAINGIPGRIPAIHLSTSAGYKYNKLKYYGGKRINVKGKSPYVFRDPTTKRLAYLPEFKEDVMDKIDRLDQGEMFPVIFADALKDERRPVEKVKQGKTRLISSTPIDLLVIMRVFFGEFVAVVQQTPATKPVAVGINAHSGQWAELLSRLQMCGGGSVMSGDYSNYDGTLPINPSKMFIDFVNWWYNDGEKNADIRRRILVSIINAHHIVYDKVYKCFRGNPSGQALTSIMNSFVNVIVLHHTLCVCLGLDESEFQLTVYGDDNVITTTRKGMRCSDLAPIIKREFNMDYTHYTKEESVNMDTLEDISYLGRKFRANLFAPLDMRVIDESLYWKRTGDDSGASLVSSVQTFFVELSHYPVEVYNMHANRMIEAVKRLCPEFEETVRKYHRPWSYFYDRKYLPGQKPLCPYIGMDHWEVEIKLTYEPISAHATYVTHSSTAMPVELNVVNTRNEQFTDRATNDPSPTQLVQLGEYHDSGPIMSSAVDSTITPSTNENLNFEDFDLNGALNREYQIDNLAWLSSDAEGVLLQTYQFPKVLFDEDFIAQKIQDFHYFTGGIRISARVVTSEVLYGTVCIAYTPLPSSEYKPATNTHQATGSPHVLVSASSGDTVVFDIPFISQYRALDIYNHLNDEMGNIKVWVMNPIINVFGDPVSASVLLMAQFIDSKLYLPHGVTATETFVKAPDGSFVPSRTAQVFTHSGNGMGGMAKGEMRTKSSNHVVAGSLQSASTGTSRVSKPKMVKQYFDTFLSYAKPTLEVLSLLGLSKPTTLALTDVVKIQPSSDLSYGKGVDTSLKISMDPENGISTTPNVAGISVDEMDFKKLLGTPQLAGTYGITASTPASLIGVCTPNDSQTTIVDNVTQFFRYYSGSYKFKIYISASKFHNVKGVFWFTDTLDTTSTWKSCYHKMVDIQGDTEVEFTLPYAAQLMAQQNISGQQVFGLYFQPLSFSVPIPSLTVPIWLNVYKAAASDFELAGLLDVSYTPSSLDGPIDGYVIETHHNPRADFAKDFPMFHQSMSGYEQKGYLFGEKYETLREVVHRYVPYYTVGTGSIAVYYRDNTVRGIEMWSLFYRFWRGSIRNKYVQNDPRFMNCVCVADPTSTASSYLGTYYSCPDNPAIEFEVPYYTNKPFLDVSQSSVITINVQGNQYHGTTATNVPFFLFKAAGDDFSLHFIRGFPPGTYIYNGPANGLGTYAFQTYLKSALVDKVSLLT